MAEPAVHPLKSFTLSETPDGFLLEIESGAGEALAVTATPEQLDAIIDALADLLPEDEVGAET